MFLDRRVYQKIGQRVKVSKSGQTSSSGSDKNAQEQESYLAIESVASTIYFEAQQSFL